MIYKTLLRPVLIYGSESMAVKKTDEQKLAGTLHRIKEYVNSRFSLHEQTPLDRTPAKNGETSHPSKVLNHIPVGKRNIDQFEISCRLMGVEDFGMLCWKETGWRHY
ncbi:hypothetical protein CWI36_0266p0070, partial [Hamiltosporidium magnivora]